MDLGCVDDGWGDEKFLTEIFQALDEAIASRNPKLPPTPIPTHPVPVSFATASFSDAPIAATASYSAPIATAPHAAAATGFSPPHELSQRPLPSLAAGSDREIIEMGHTASGRGFSPPRNLSQRPPSPSAESDCEIVGVVGPAVDRSGAARRELREAERREVERLKRELNRVSKQLNDLKNECGELKKDRTKKDLEIRSKDAVIQNLKKANVGNTGEDLRNMGLDIDQVSCIPAIGALHAGSGLKLRTKIEKSNGKEKEVHSSRDDSFPNQKDQTGIASEVLELKHWTMIDNSTSTSGRVSLKESSNLESKDIKCKESKTVGVQTELPWNSEHSERKRLSVELICSTLRAIWAMPNSSLMGRELISKILVSCSEDIFALFQHSREQEKCETSSELSSSMNDAISQVYGIFIKMHGETMPIKTFLQVLINFCAVGNAIVVSRALRILHCVLQHLLNCGTMSNQRNNVSVEQYPDNKMHKERSDHKTSSTLMSTPDAEKLFKGYGRSYIESLFLPFTFWSSVFTVMLQIAVKHLEENIRVDALSIMILIVMASEPKGEREKFEFTSIMESLHRLLQKENGLLVKKHSVYLLFLLLNCPKMLKLLCSGGKDGSEQTEAENDRSQQAVGSILEDLSDCLSCGTTGSLGLKLCRQVIVLLAYIASNGKLGYEVLLGPVTPRGANFLELIMQVLAEQMEAEIADSTEAQDLLKERHLLMREALILLNRLVSHANFSKATLEVLTSSKLCATITIDVAHRLPRSSRYHWRHLGAINPQMANDFAELARGFRARVYNFLEEQHPTTDPSVLR